MTLALIEVSFTQGKPSIYHLPLNPATGALLDPEAESHRLKAIAGAMVHGITTHAERGDFHFTGGGLDPMAPPGSSSVRAMGAEQSNTPIVFDEKVILKLFRKVAWGENPDLELNRVLNVHEFANVPLQVGDISYEKRRRTRRRTSTWPSPSSSSRKAERAGAPPWPTWASSTTRWKVATTSPIRSSSMEAPFAIEELGEVTGSLHVAFAQEGSDPPWPLSRSLPPMRERGPRIPVTRWPKSPSSSRT